MSFQRPPIPIIMMLNNGMRIVLSPTSEVNLTSFFLRVSVGSSYEEKYLGSGISHFLEHSIFLGSKKHPSCDEFSQLIESYGGTDFNAHTVNDHTAYYFTVFSKYIKPTLMAFRDFIENPLFEKSLVEDERGTVLSEMDMYEDKVNDWYYHFIQQQLYQKNTSKFPVIGLRSQFKKITPDDLRAFHRKHYVPSKMVLSIVGNFDLSKIGGQLEASFGNFGTLKSLSGGRKKVLPKVLPQAYIPVKPEAKLIKDTYAQTTHPRAEFPSVTMVWSTLPLKTKNDMERYGLDVLSYLLASHKGSILYDDLKEKSQLVESVSAYSKVGADNGFFKLKFNLSNRLPRLVDERLSPLTLSAVRKWIALVEQRMYGLFRRIDKLIDESMLEGVKNTFLKHHLDEQESYLDTAMSLADSLVELGHVNENENFIQAVSQITLKDIQKLVEKYLSPKRPKHQIFLLPPSLYRLGKYNPTTTKLKDFNGELLKDLKNKNYETTKCKSVSLGHMNSSLAIKVKQVKKEVVPVKRAKTYSSSVGGKLVKRTLLHHLNTRFPKTFLMLRFGGGALYEDYLGESKRGLIPGSYHLLAEMLFTANSRFPNLELSQFLKRHGIGYHSFCGESSIGISFSFLNSKFSEVMEVLKAISSESKFSVVDFERERKELLYQMEKSRENLNYVASLYFKKGFFRKTRLSLPIAGDLKTVKKIKKASLEELKQEMFASKCVASLYGDYTASSKKELTKWLASLGLSKETKKGNKINQNIKKYRPLKLFPFSNRNVIHYEKNIKQSVFHLAYRVAPFGHKDVPVLEVFNSYLSGFGGPLFKLRSMSFEKDGKKLGGRAYRIGSSYRVAVDYGLFVFMVNFREEAEDEYRWAKRSFINILNNLKVNSIPKTELERAKETLLAEKLMDSIRLQHRAHQENTFEYLGVGYSSFSEYQKSWGKVSSADLIRVVKKYFKSEYFSHILLPKAKIK